MSEKSFLDKLRNGVQNIESEVKRLKQLSENGYQRSDEQMAEDLNIAKRFDSDIRQTYVDVSQVYHTIKGSNHPLLESKQKIQSLKQMLFDIEDNSGLKNYGYKPFVEQYSDSDDNVFIDDHNSQQMAANCLNIDSNEKTLNSKQLFEEMTRKPNESEERTEQTIRFRAGMAVSSQSDNTVVKQDCNQMVTKKYDQLLARTPQPYDFGISRRFTLLPQLNKYNANNKSTPEEPTYDSTQTCRFNYINNGLSLGSAVNPMTPPNVSSNSVNNADSFVTVEFTPGLTTKRPKGVSRVNANKNKLNNNLVPKDSKPMVESIHRLPQTILQSVENDKITPEQPIPASNSTKSAKILRSIAGKSSGTPPLPKTRVNVNFHNQILKNL